MEKTSFYAYIALNGKEFDDYSLETVTEILGLQPTETWKLGERVYPNKPNNPLERTYTCWKFKTDKIETLDSEDVLRPILDIFESKISQVNQLKSKFNLKVSLAVVSEVYDGEIPAFVIYPNFSRFLVAIDAWIEFDTYVFSLGPEE